MLLIRRALSLLGLPDGSSRSDRNMTDEIDNHFIPHVTDVLDVKSFLWQKKLPVELIDSIIGIAEYWPRYVASVENPVTVVRDGKVLYIQSQPLPGLFTLGSLEDGGEREEFVVGGVETSTTNPARRIVFRIWSHDQGWSSNRGQGMSPLVPYFVFRPAVLDSSS